MLKVVREKKKEENYEKMSHALEIKRAVKQFMTLPLMCPHNLINEMTELTPK